MSREQKSYVFYHVTRRRIVVNETSIELARKRAYNTPLDYWEITDDLQLATSLPAPIAKEIEHIQESV